MTIAPPHRADRCLISIIIPTFNSERVIRRCLTSITSQTSHAYEIVVMDGGSTDQTCQIVTDFASKGWPISLWSERDDGVYDAMNRGVSVAQGEWLLFLGSDDVFYNHQVLAKIARHLTSDFDLVYGNVISRGTSSWAKDGAIYDGPFEEEKILERNICHQAIFYARSLFRRHGGYDLTYKVLADWEYNLRVFRSARKKYVDVIVAAFESGGMSTEQVDHEFLARLPEIVDRSFHLPTRAGFYRQRWDDLLKLSKLHWARHNYLRAARFIWIWLLNADVKVARRQVNREWTSEKTVAEA